MSFAREDGLSFYKAIDLPGRGSVPGIWDHRGSENVYLAHTDFNGRTALDVGPANGLWSFEMERRGARVTAIELGHDDDWDMVPYSNPQDGLAGIITSSVESSVADFWMCHAAFNSQVELKLGTAYAVPDLVENTDVAMMGNILQHLRDPFLAIERVASIARQRIIISESVWFEDEAFMNAAL
jgi:hypothetical protein